MSIAVAGRSRLLGDDHALLAEQRVEEARLARVRPPEDRDADRVLARLGRAAPGEAGDDRVEQVARAVSVHRGERNRVAEAEPVELQRVRLAPGLVDLVRDQEDRLVRVPEDRRQLLVARRDPGPGVDDEEDEVGFGDRRPRLVGDLLGQRRAVGDVDAARVDEQEAVAGPLADELLAVARDSGCLVDDGLASAGQPVDERGLADVREADDGDRAEQLVVHGGVAPLGRPSSCCSTSQLQRRWISSWISTDASR